MGKSFFITGTGKGSGKTYVAGLLTKKLKRNGLKTAYYKPVLCSKDTKETEIIKQMSGIEQPAETMSSYAFQSSLLPYQAASMERTDIEIDTIKTDFASLEEGHDCVIVEGEGGIVCPIRLRGGEIWQEDIIKVLDLSCVIVASPDDINGITLTSEYMKSYDIPVKGVIYNRCHLGNMMEDDLIFAIEKKTGLRTVAKITNDAQDLDTEISEISVLFR